MGRFGKIKERESKELGARMCKEYKIKVRSVTIVIFCYI